MQESNAFVGAYARQTSRCASHVRTSLQCRLDQAAHRCRQRLFAKVACRKYAVLMVDGWADHRHCECLGTLVLNLEDPARRSMLLDVTEQTTRQTAENIGAYIKKQVDLLEFNECRVITVIAVITDNAANMSAAVGGIPNMIWLNCLAHSAEKVLADLKTLKERQTCRRMAGLELPPHGLNVIR